ncbi:uncharacterized protein F4807DRAFT_440974 [Annulohypoxylon truncatum]|uniref:uncharacterized protein n=1 Tax=Annulohypoxylon truncatum TaxID=327061 RepID=UPI002007D636|nr:uncharacterized protein F4807DRAFT_440974 [Annulohypoxylon truncatum]KAI1205921.1 hypothetical protein F4807DRAFT_440974 [Annulohypoxylon truncatum]
MELEYQYVADGQYDVDDSEGAPILDVPQRKIVAIEHPCVLINLDKGLDTFGVDPDFQKLLVDTPEPTSVPLWFRPDNPTSKPIVSHHAATNNILLKITVPKRTGRKRKRGSNGPFIGDVDVTNGTAATATADEVSSVSRRDRPKSILRKMQDNLDYYEIEAVGKVEDTHRYRGLSDFQFANVPSSFLTKTAENLLPMKVSKLREIKFAPGVISDPGQEIVPPPHFTDRIIGFNYNYEQNPNTKVEGDEMGNQKLINIQGRKKHSYGYFINHNTYPVPQKPRREPNMVIPGSLMRQLHALMEERPIWTRRAILNRVTGNYTDSAMRIALQLVGYQFRGGPWRDAFVKYGMDPRPDPKNRVYQTLAFKLERNIIGTKKVPWEVVRKGQIKKHHRENRKSHIWDGEDYSTDGKFWQVCDITDPFVRNMLDQAPLRTECDIESGWYFKSAWVKIKMIMKVKMIAIKRGRMGSDDDHPQKPGFLYNSFLAERLRQWPDKTEKPLGLTLEPFLRPIADVDTTRIPRKRRPPQLKQIPGSTAAGTPSSTGGDNLNDRGLDGNSDDEEEAIQENPWEVDDLIYDLEDDDGDIDGDVEEYDGYSDDDDDDEEEGEDYLKGYGYETEQDEYDEDDDVAMNDHPTEDTYDD